MEECRNGALAGREAEDFARLMLQTIERLSQDGSWIRATDAFEQTLGNQADHAYISQLRQSRPGGSV